MQIVTRYFVVKIFFCLAFFSFFDQFYFESERSVSDNLLSSSVPRQFVVMYFYRFGVPPLRDKPALPFVLKFSFGLLGLFSPRCLPLAPAYSDSTAEELTPSSLP